MLPLELFLEGSEHNTRKAKVAWDEVCIPLDKESLGNMKNVY